MTGEMVRDLLKPLIGKSGQISLLVTARTAWSISTARPGGR